MPLGPSDRAPPPFFKQGPSARAKFLFFGLLSVCLMFADLRLQWAHSVRSTLSLVLEPLQWLALQPVRWTQDSQAYLSDLDSALNRADQAQTALLKQSQRAALVEHLQQENQELRALLDMRQALSGTSHGAEILYESADPYVRKVILNRGSFQGIREGSAVIDALGVLGQVTRVYPLTAEVRLLTDHRQLIPVLNPRTGQRSLAYGLADADIPTLELRHMLATADIQVGDLLITSGIDGVYPPGLHVAHVTEITPVGDGGFARVLCEPVARTGHSRHVLVLDPSASFDPVQEEASKRMPPT